MFIAHNPKQPSQAPAERHDPGEASLCSPAGTGK